MSVSKTVRMKNNDAALPQSAHLSSLSMSDQQRAAEDAACASAVSAQRTGSPAMQLGSHSVPGPVDAAARDTQGVYGYSARRESSKQVTLTDDFLGAGMEKELGTQFHTSSPANVCQVFTRPRPGDKIKTPAVLKLGERVGPSKPKSACTLFVQILSSTDSRTVRV